MNNLVTSPRPQGGFTLVELTVVMLILLTVTAATVPNYVEDIHKARTEATINEVWNIIDGAQNFVANNGNWPDESNGCADALSTMRAATGYIDGVEDESPWHDPTDNPDGDYDTSCTTDNFTVTVTTDPEWAGLVANTLPATEIAGAETTTSVPVPGEVPGLASLLPRDGSRPMTGDLDMDGNNVENAGNVAAESVQTINDIDAGGDIFANGNISADTVIGRNGVSAPVYFDSDDTSYFTDPNSTSVMQDIQVDGNVVSTVKNRSLTQAVQDATVATHGATVAKPNCPTGESPRIFNSVAMASCNNTGSPPAAIQTWSIDNGGNYQVVLRVRCDSGWVNPQPEYGRVTVFTKCD